MRTNHLIAFAVLASAVAFSCSAPRRSTSQVPSGGQGAQYVDADTQFGDISGLGLESQDYVRIADEMTRSVLARADFGEGEKPLIGISSDPQFFNNDTSMTQLDPSLFLEQLRTQLQLNASNRLRFVSLDATESVQRFRDEELAGLTEGTRELSTVKRPDFFLESKISEQMLTNASTGAKSRYTVITLSFVDLNRETRWIDQFRVKKAGRDDIVYQ